LYDWVRTAEKHKTRAKKKSPAEQDEEDTLEYPTGEVHQYEEDNSCQFLSPHAQAQTHAVKMLPEHKSFVPNFVGGTLPRRNKGNREEYCMMMLSLFRPWRVGLDLKVNDKTWDEEFSSHLFEQRHKDVMGFLNLKYECSNARDDYAAQRRKMKSKEDFVDFFRPDASMDDLDRERHVDNTAEEWDEGELAAEFQELLLDPSDLTQRHNLQKQQIERVMRTSGWLDPLVDGDITKLARNDNVAFDMNSANEWKNVLMAKRDSILKQKFEQADNKKAHSTIPVTNPGVVDTIKVVDGDYINKNFSAEDVDAQQQVEDTVKLFGLNTEQERAFRIVANHSAKRTKSN
jgi:hypothetical protein